MTIKLPDLPYGRDELEPFMSSKTLEFHHGKHHSGYVDKLNKAIEGTAYDGLDLEKIVVRAADNGDEKIFNNAAQALNHEIFWKSLTPKGGGEPQGALNTAFASQFNGLDDFKAQFKAAATGQFGSGWTWLASDADGRLQILSTGNADTPLTQGLNPLLTLDVWEHAYYLDHQNDRGTFVDTFLNELVNWSFAEVNFADQKQAA